MWITKIWLKGLDNKKIKSLQEKCEDILKKDPTFKFKILQYDEKSKKYTGFDKTKKGGDCYLMVFSSSKDKSHRRGVWLINKIDELKGKGYNVEFKEKI